jgi:hypothetical protein
VGVGLAQGAEQQLDLVGAQHHAGRRRRRAGCWGARTRGGFWICAAADESEKSESAPPSSASRLVQDLITVERSRRTLARGQPARLQMAVAIQARQRQYRGRRTVQTAYGSLFPMRNLNATLAV